MDVLLTILVIVVVLAGCFWLLTKVTMEVTVRNIVTAVLAIIGILLLLGVLFGRVPLVPFGW